MTFNPATGNFSQLRLPDAGESESMAVLDDGTIGAGMLNYKGGPGTVAIFSPSDRLTIATAESTQISAWGDGFLTSGVGATSVRIDGSTAPVDLGRSQGNQRLRPAELSDGRVVMVSNDRGLLVLDPSAKKATGTITLGTTVCDLRESSMPLPGGSTTAAVPQTIECPVHPRRIAAASADLLVDLGPKGLHRAVAGTF